MEYLILVAIVLIGALLLYFFGQHRNNFELVISEIIDLNGKNVILVEGIVQSGWICVSQEVFIRKENKWNSFSVVGIESEGGIRRKAIKDEKIRLMLTGSKTKLIESGSMLTTSKTKLEPVASGQRR